MVERVTAFGWADGCLRLANADAELIVTTAIGPRVLSYRLTGAGNLLRVFQEETGRSGEAEYIVRGGHRLWASPETDLSYVPDNGPVEIVSATDRKVCVANAGCVPWYVRKELTLTLAETGSHVVVRHRLINEGAAAQTVASWGLTVMEPGGWEIIPQPPLGKHGDDFLPDRIVVPWTYTDLSDPRWRFGTRFWRLTPEAGRPATKLGFLHHTGWAGYAHPHGFFLKTCPYERGATYPDLGCNYETYSKDVFIELETLSPLRTLAPGETVEHTEEWHLFADTPAATLDDDALAAWLQPRLATLSL